MMRYTNPRLLVLYYCRPKTRWVFVLLPVDVARSRVYGGATV